MPADREWLRPLCWTAFMVLATAGGRFDQLWPAAPGTVFDLVVCTQRSGCEPPVPNIS